MGFYQDMIQAERTEFEEELFKLTDNNHEMRKQMQKSQEEDVSVLITENEQLQTLLDQSKEKVLSPSNFSC